MNKDDIKHVQDARARKPADKPLTAADVYGRAGLLAFDRRSARAAWRGSRGRRPTCAARAHAGDARDMLRAFSDAAPALLDARFTDEDRIAPEHYFGRFQVVVVASGSGASCRTARHLANGQVVVLVRNEDEFDLWYYPLLRPWLDFVPVRFGDGVANSSGELASVLETLASDAALRETISANAQAFWNRYFLHFDEIGQQFVCGLARAQRERGVRFDLLPSSTCPGDHCRPN